MGGFRRGFDLVALPPGGLRGQPLESRGPVTLQGLEAESTTTRHNVVHKLTDITTSNVESLARVVDATAVTQAGQLVIAILGRLTEGDVQMLLQTRRDRAQAMALIIDADTFAPRAERAKPAEREAQQRAIQVLRDHSWRVTVVTRSDSISDAWANLESMGELV